LSHQLYEAHKVKLEKRLHRAKAEEEKRTAIRSTSKVSQKTDQLVLRQKQSAFQELFKMLDSDKDGKISGQKISVN